MKFNLKIKICLYKRYFDTGLALTNYFKYFIILFGAYSFVEKIDLKITFVLMILYAVGCFVLGWAWLNSDFYKADIEISNKYNLFVAEMRKKIGKPNK